MFNIEYDVRRCWTTCSILNTIYEDVEQAVQYIISCSTVLNKVFSIEYYVRRCWTRCSILNMQYVDVEQGVQYLIWCTTSEVWMLGWNVGSLENVFGWSAPLFFDWLSSQSVIEQCVQYLISCTQILNKMFNIEYAIRRCWTRCSIFNILYADVEQRVQYLIWCTTVGDWNTKFGC